MTPWNLLTFEAQERLTCASYSGHCIKYNVTPDWAGQSAYARAEWRRKTKMRYVKACKQHRKDCRLIN